jgi:amino acid permease
LWRLALWLIVLYFQPALGYVIPVLHFILVTFFTFTVVVVVSSHGFTRPRKSTPSTSPFVTAFATMGAIGSWHHTVGAPCLTYNPGFLR